MSVVEQARLADLPDDELRSLVGSLHESLKRLKDAQSADEEINALKEQAKELNDERYGSALKQLSRKLSAARKVAQLKGITFVVPEIGGE